MPPSQGVGAPASPNILEPPANAHTVWPRAAEFGVITCGGVACF